MGPLEISHTYKVSQRSQPSRTKVFSKDRSRGLIELKPQRVISLIFCPFWQTKEKLPAKIGFPLFCCFQANRQRWKTAAGSIIIFYFNNSPWQQNFRYFKKLSLKSDGKSFLVALRKRKFQSWHAMIAAVIYQIRRMNRRKQLTTDVMTWLVSISRF